MRVLAWHCHVPKAKQLLAARALDWLVSIAAMDLDARLANDDGFESELVHNIEFDLAHDVLLITRSTQRVASPVAFSIS